MLENAHDLTLVVFHIAPLVVVMLGSLQLFNRFFKRMRVLYS